MKILEEKKPLEKWALRVVCNGGTWTQGDKIPCGSTLEIEGEDLLKRTWFKFGYGAGIDYGFICPVCGSFTDISKKEINLTAMNMAKNYDDVVKNLNKNDSGGVDI